MIVIAGSLATAQAQSPMPARRFGPNGAPEGFIRVNTTLNIFMPGPTGEGEEADKLRDRARRMIYSTAARECDLLRETLAQECGLDNVTSNLNAAQRYQSGQPEGYNVSGTFAFYVKLKNQ